MKKAVKARVSAAYTDGPGQHSVLIVAKSAKLMPWALKLPVKRDEIAALIGRNVTIMIVVEGEST